MTGTVGILGGGMQGCCIALALAERGEKVVLFERENGLLRRTAVANEGKIHLGYMYAADPSLATARTMMQGALAFEPFLRRHLGLAEGALATSVPAAYVVHRDSQHGAREVGLYLAEVHRLLGEAAAGRERDYFGMDLSRPLVRWPDEERVAAFGAEAALAVFATPEIAVDPVELAEAVRAVVASHPDIELRLGRTVVRVEEGTDAIRVVHEGDDGVSVDRFDHVVNALWDGRLAIDETMGMRPDRPWLHRLKYGVSFTLPPGVEAPPSATFVSGPFGEVVTYRDRTTYLTWYPECIHGMSSEVTPPRWENHPGDPLRSQIVERTLDAMSEIVPGLAKLRPNDLTDARVKGGAIVAWGETDIYDPGSELHRRYEIGVTSAGRYHSVDPGKLTMAPYFAERCAERIARSTPLVRRTGS